ncbi:MAG: LuxR C-terminal-related transcriptional regulator [Treponema sp.]|jgi:LuxR family maltose regulon positive regulatory protein|nr:LuxR C-terminal-related transcriptional regulator [Treponema sp.]
MAGKIIYREPHPLSSPPYYFERPRLNETLDRALQHPVITVVGGQGYGKTSAVYSFLESYSVVSMWVQLSLRDNITRHFWENLCSCVALKNLELGNALLGLGFPETDRQFDRFYVLIEESMKAAIKSSASPAEDILHYVIVYDDFHLIQDPAMLRLFDRILAFPLLSTSVILIARTEPEVKILPLLSKGLLARVTVEDLRFTAGEMAAYFSMQHLTVPRDDMDRLWRDTEGWPQVISLIAQDAIRQNRHEIRYSPELVKVPLFNMIESSFFSSLDKDTRSFLIKLSLGEHWPLEVLDKLDRTGEKRLELEKITPLIRYDSYLNGYRIHNLLTEFLKAKQQELSVEERRDVYCKCAEWCLDNNLRMDAAMYYEKARDYRGLLNLIFTLPIIISGETASFFLSVVERMLSEDEDEELTGDDDCKGMKYREIPLYLRFVARSKLLFAMSRFEEAAAICRQAIAQFEGQIPEFRPGEAGQNLYSINIQILAPVYFCLGYIGIFTCRYTGNYGFAPYFEKAYRYFAAKNVLVSKSFSQGNVSSYICQVGFPAEQHKFETYFQAYAPAAPLIAKMGKGHHAGFDSLGRCEYCYYKGDLKAAENFARQAIIQARGSRQYETENRGLFFLLKIAIHGGNFSEMEELFRQFRAQLDIEDYRNRYVLYDIECGWFYAQTGQPLLVASWLRSDFEFGETGDILRPLVILVKAKCFYAEKHYDAALSMLAEGKGYNRLDSFLLGKLDRTVLEAACYLHLEDRLSAMKKLEEAWEISRDYGLDTPFIELGEDMRLLASLAQGGAEASGSLPAAENPEPEEISCGRIPAEWFESLRNRAAAYGKMITAAAAHGPKPAEFRKDGGTILRRREEAVLSALSRGLTRQEIADQENLSLNAVKELIKNIYQKLGAVNRADAVRIALASGILKKISR